MSGSAGESISGEDLLERVAGISRYLAEAETLDETLQRIVDRAEDYLTDCDGVSLMLVGRRGKVTTPASSAAVAHESDQLQYETGEGPCLTAMRENETIIIDDLETDQRFPAYRAGALELGVRSMISFRLFMAEDTLGALNLHSRKPHAFDRRSHAVGQVFASHAAIAMKAAIAQEGLEAAITSRDVIGQAKGLLMERQGMTSDQAFRRLRELSQQHNKPIRVLAGQIAETGELPE